jgi:hypothetical protein
MTYFGGIDPGLKGGMAIINEAGGLEKFEKLPFGDDGFPDSARLKMFFLDCAHVAIEIQHTRMMQSGASTTMVNYGYLLGCLSCHHIVHVPPLEWLKWLHGEEYKKIAGADKKKQRKLATAKKIQDRFPSQIRPNISDGITDAIAIALFGQRQH